MNERIRELYYECQDESQSTEQCYQRFAELIVRECADVATMNQFQYDAVGNYVLKHFEVE